MAFLTPIDPDDMGFFSRHAGITVDAGAHANEFLHNGIGDWAMSFWVRPRAPAGNYFEYREDVSPAGPVLGWNVGLQPVHKLSFLIQGTNGNVLVQSDQEFSNTNTWRHVLMIERDTTGMQMYVNGDLQSGSTTDTKNLDFVGVGTGVMELSGAAADYAHVAFWDNDTLDFSAGSGITIAQVWNNGVPPDLNAIPVPPNSWWKFDSSDTTTVITDHGTNGFNASVVGGTTKTITEDPTVSTSYSINEGLAREYITAGADNSYINVGTGDWAITGWFKSGRESNKEQSIVSYEDSTGKGWEVFMEPHDSAAGARDRLYFRTNDGTLSSIIVHNDAGMATRDTWSHFAAVVRGGQMELHIDENVSFPSAVTSVNLTSAIVGDMRIGKSNDSEINSQGMGGEISNVAFWDATITQTHLDEIYNGGVPPDLNSLATAPSPDSWWILDEGSTPFSDSGSLNNTGNLITATQTCTVDEYFDFNGIDQIIQSPLATDVQPGVGNFVFSAWVYSTASGVQQTIAAFEKPDNSAKNGYSLSINSSNKVVFNEQNGASASVTSDISIGGDNEWHLITGSRTSNELILWVDDVIQSETNQTPINVTAASQTLAFGASPHNGGEEFFEGRIAHVTYWGGANWTQQRQEDLFNDCTPSDVQSHSEASLLKTWYGPFDFENIAAIQDKEGTNTATPSGMTQNDIVGALPPIDITAETGFITFDGNDDFLEGTNIPDVTDNKTFTFWFNSDNLDAAMTPEQLVHIVNPGAEDTDYISIGLADGRLVASANDSNGASNRSSVLASGTWYHAEVSKFTGNILDIRINAVYDTDSAISFVDGPTAGYRIASNIDGAPPNNFKGQMTGFAIWEEVLNQGEVDELFNDGVPTNVLDHSVAGTDLRVYLPMGSGDTFPYLSDLNNGGGSVEMFNMDASALAGAECVVPDFVHFDGIDDKFDFGQKAEYIDFGTGDFTQSIWFRSERTGTSEHLAGYFHNSDIGGNDRWSLNIGGGGADLITFVIGEGGGGFETAVSDDTLLAGDNKWHNAVGMYRSGALHLYIDGVKQTDTNATAISLDDFVGGEYTIADRTVSPQPFQGDLAHNSIWDKGLSDAEVTELFNNCTPGTLTAHSAVANLVSWWPMGSGDAFPTITDAGPSGNDGTASNMTAGNFVTPSTPCVGNLDTYLTFDGSDQQLLVPHTSTMDDLLNPIGTNDYSISGWFKSDVSSSDYQYISFFGESGGNTQISLNIVQNDDVLIGNRDKVQFFSRGTSTTERVFSNNTFAGDGLWHYAAGVRRNNVLELYIDGIQQAQTKVDNGVISSSANSQIGIGGHPNLNNFFDGQVAQVSFWDKALTVEEIREEHNGCDPIDLLTQHSASGNVDALWGPSQGDFFPTVFDQVGGNHANMLNMASGDLNIDGVAGGSGCNVEEYFSINGVDSYVAVGNSPELYAFGTADFTYAAWIRSDGSTGADQSIMANSTNQGTLGQDVIDLFIDDTSGKVGWLIQSNTETDIILSDEPIKGTGAWMHVAGTRTSGGVMRTYINGVQQSVTGSSTANLDAPTNVSFAIGRKPENFYANPSFSGGIADVTVFNQDLSPQQIIELMNDCTPLDINTHSASGRLVSWWGPEDGDFIPMITDQALGAVAGFNDGMTTNFGPGDLVGVTPPIEISLDTGFITFDGDDDFISFEEIPDVTGDKSFSFWFNSDNLDSGMVDEQLFYIVNTGSENDDYISISLEQGFVLASADNEAIDSLQTAPLASGTWYNIVVTKSSGNVENIYVNSIECDDVAIASFGGSLAGFEIGTNPAFPPPTIPAFEGSITNFAIWDDILTEPEIVELFGSGTPPDLTTTSMADDLQNYWPMGSGDFFPTLNDQVGDINGTMENMDADSISRLVLFTFDIETTLDGTANCISMGSSDDLINFGTGDFTISSWVKSTASGVNNQNFGGYGDVAGSNGEDNYGLTVVQSDDVTAPNTFRFFIQPEAGSATSIHSNDIVASGGAWHHVVGVRESGNMKMYVDRVAQSGVDTDATDLSNGASSFVVGCFGEGITNFFQGGVRHVSVWNKALSQAEVDEANNGDVPLNLHNHSASDNLVGWWPLGKGDRDLLFTDWVGNNDGVGDASMEAGDIRRQIELTEFTRFDGGAPGALSHYKVTSGQVPDELIAFGTGDFTTTGWFRSTKLSPVGENQHIFSIQNDDGAQDNGRIILNIVAQDTPVSSGTFDFFVSQPGATQSRVHSDNQVAADGLWHYFAAMRESGTLKLFLDDIEQVDVDASAQSLAGASISRAVIGASEFAGNVQQGLEGDIAHIARWNVALSRAQVTEAYNNGVPPNLNKHSAVDGLVSWWPMGENKGSVEDCSINNSFDLVATNSPSGSFVEVANTSVFQPKVLQFNEFATPSERITIGTVEDMIALGSKDFMVSAWVQIPNLLDSAANGFFTIISTSSVGAVNESRWELRINATDATNASKLNWFVGDTGGSTTVFSDDIVEINRWYHVVGMRQNGTLKMYVDNVLQAETAADTSILIPPVLDTYETVVGMYPKDGGKQFMRGQITHVSFWKGAIKECDIDELWNDGTPPDINQHSSRDAVQ